MVFFTEWVLIHWLRLLTYHKQKLANLLRIFFGKFPDINNYINNTKVRAKKDGYIRTFTNRRRLFTTSEISDHRTDRQAVNSVIQGTAADIVKIAMIKIDKELKQLSDGLGATTRMILQIHDDLVFEVKETQLNEAMEFVRACMENAIILKVPLPVQMRVGSKWGSMEKVGSVDGKVEHKKPVVTDITEMEFEFNDP